MMLLLITMNTALVRLIIIRTMVKGSFLLAYRRCNNVSTWIDLYHVHIEWMESPLGRSISFFFLFSYFKKRGNNF